MIPTLGSLIMNNHTRMILWVVLLLVGLQWVVPDPSDASLTGAGIPTAAWNDLDDNDDLDDFDLDGHTPPTDLAFFPHDMTMAGVAILGWLLLSSDSNNLRRLAISHRIPRAPPASLIQIALYLHSLISIRSSARSVIIPSSQSLATHSRKHSPTVSTVPLFQIVNSRGISAFNSQGKEVVFAGSNNDRASMNGLNAQT